MPTNLYNSSIEMSIKIAKEKRDTAVEKRLTQKRDVVNIKREMM
jgi:hypothetical protein